MSSHRQFIPYQERVAIAPVSRQNRKCIKCRIPLSNTPYLSSEAYPEGFNGGNAKSSQMCDVCWSMLEAVANPYWHDIQASWNHENDIRAARKAMLLDPDYGVNGDNNPQV